MGGGKIIRGSLAAGERGKCTQQLFLRRSLGGGLNKSFNQKDILEHRKRAGTHKGEDKKGNFPLRKRSRRLISRKRHVQKKGRTDSGWKKPIIKRRKKIENLKTSRKKIPNKSPRNYLNKGTAKTTPERDAKGKHVKGITHEKKYKYCTWSGGGGKNAGPRLCRSALLRKTEKPRP